MKLGILTFHSQLNYGGVLQCWALQETLERMGHEVVVIDREFEHQIRSLSAIFRGWSVVRFVKWVMKCILGRKDALQVLRYMKTVQFVKQHLHLTDYSFKNWEDAPKDLGLDLIVVGSDQVWNGIWQDPGPYLLEGAQNVPAIGYAVSLGMKDIPERYFEKYRLAAGRFRSVSVRESECIEILRKVGIEAQHVADPVLLKDWSRFRVNRSVGLLCYFIGEEGVCDEAIETLESYAARSGDSVSVYVYGRAQRKNIFTKHVHVRYAAGPKEFVEGMAAAKWIISDSFHALMFATIFNKNVKIVKPDIASGSRQNMFARIYEFVNKYVVGTCVVNSVNAALQSLENESPVLFKKLEIAAFVDASHECLDNGCLR